MRARIAYERLNELQRRRLLRRTSAHNPVPLLIGEHREVLHRLHISPTGQRFLRAWDVDMPPGALSAALEPLTIACQLVRVFDCGRAPCKGHARNQPNRQNARISHRRLASSRIPRELPGISIPEQLSGQGRRSHDALGRNAQVKSLNQGSPGNRGKGNGVKVSNGSSQSARKNTATVRAEPIASSTISSLSRSRLMQRQRSEQRATASQPNPCGSMCCVLINPLALNGGYCGTPSTPMMRNFACLLPAHHPRLPRQHRRGLLPGRIRKR